MKVIESNTRLIMGIFSGTYETIWDPGYFEEYDDNNNLLEYEEDYIFNSKKYMRNILDAYNTPDGIIPYNKVLEGLKEAGITTIKNIKFTGSFSPKYYNYSNDGLDIKLTVLKGFEDEILKKCIELKGLESFEKYLEDNYTSYDGFSSFTPNTIEGIKSELSGGSEYDQAVGACLSYILDGKEIEYDIYCDHGTDCVYNAIKYINFNKK